jgi:phosphatidylglycerophosphatase GEP4
MSVGVTVIAIWFGRRGRVVPAKDNDAHQRQRRKQHTPSIINHIPSCSTNDRMVQSINGKAIWTLATIARRPSLLVPQLSVDTVSDIDYGALRHQHGIRAVVFDKDHTLTAPYDQILHPSARRGLEQADAVFGRRYLAILSNSAGTDDDVGHRDAQAIETSLQLAVIRHSEKKPGGLKEVLQHFSTAAGNGDDNDDDVHPREICVVGDRILTDVVFGNLHGMYTIHTQALPPVNGSIDNWTARILRPLENALIYGRWTRSFWQQRKVPHQRRGGSSAATRTTINDSADNSG